MAGQALAGGSHVSSQRQAQRGEQVKRALPAVEVMAAMNQHRHALAGQQQRHQWHQVGLLARAIEAGQEHAARAVGHQDLRGARLHRPLEGQQFFSAFALDAQAQQDGAELQVGHLAIQDGAEQVFGLLGRHVAGAARAAADFLDEGGVQHRASVDVANLVKTGCDRP